MEFRLGFEKISFFISRKHWERITVKAQGHERVKEITKLDEGGIPFPTFHPPKPSAYYRRYYSYLKASGKDSVKRESEDAK